LLDGHRRHAGQRLAILMGKWARSPITKISGCPGMLRSGSTCTRPARSNVTPVCLANTSPMMEAFTLRSI
jgi:hypothetical protein